MEWPATLKELAKGMNPPRVVVDNKALPSATLVEVDSTSNRQRHLLAAVQTLTDLDLDIKKAYVSSDGPWFMGVFHVADNRGLKLADPNLVRSICASATAADDDASGVDPTLAGLTTLELTGMDRPGILSEVFAVLRDLECNVVEAKAWTHNGRIASLIFVKDHHSGGRIEEDPGRVRAIETRLRNVLSGDHDVRGAKTAVAPPPVTHSDRRLHQLMFADGNFERSAVETTTSSSTSISVQKCEERDYSIVSIHCCDRPKLPFDVVCTLTDMNYVVFHGTMDISGDRAYQEFYIRHANGYAIKLEAERQRVTQCLQAAIERGASKGLRLELRTPDRKGLLADVTRTFRENGLSITRAEVATRDGMAMNVFYVIDTSGQLPDRTTINAVIEGIGSQNIKLINDKDQILRRRRQKPPPSTDGGGRRAAALGLFSLGSLLMRNLYSLGAWGLSDHPDPVCT